MYTHPFFEATPPGAAPGPPVKIRGPCSSLPGVLWCVACAMPLDARGKFGVHTGALYLNIKKPNTYVEPYIARRTDRAPYEHRTRCAVRPPLKNTSPETKC